jgi:MFS family permease
VRGTLDVEREPTRSIHPRVLFHWRNLVSSALVLRCDRSLTALTALAISFAMVQGCLFSFAVTYLVGKGFSLGEAGSAYAAMQAAGVFARIFLGWFADRTGWPAANLTGQAYVAALMVALFALVPAGAGLATVALVSAACGFFAVSWNGIVMAEVARLAPQDRISDATAGSTMFIFMGYVVAPSVFSFLVSWTGSWRIPLLLIAAQLALMALLQTGLLIRSGSPRRRSPPSLVQKRSEAA